MPALPSILLGSAQSLHNKLDELEAWATVRQKITNACLLVFMESWLKDTNRNEDLSVEGRHTDWIGTWKSPGNCAEEEFSFTLRE
uniref:Uncharacterized protein n=1 Tax=Knipowitschia caucasica TaxID=637954 RepID=A0AAV2JW49_KNICA